MSSRITIRGIRGHGYHGVLAEERKTGQTFIVDVDYGIAPVANDDLSATVDYAAVAQIAHDAITGSPYDLIETLCSTIAAEILQLAGVQDVVVTVHKPQAPIPLPFDDVTITVRRP